MNGKDLGHLSDQSGESMGPSGVEPMLQIAAGSQALCINIFIHSKHRPEAC